MISGDELGQRPASREVVVRLTFAPVHPVRRSIFAKPNFAQGSWANPVSGTQRSNPL
jgi:hypothetical protein